MAKPQTNSINVALDLIKGEQIDAIKDFATAARGLTDQLSVLSGTGGGSGPLSSRVGSGRAQRSFQGGTVGGNFAGGGYSNGPSPHTAAHASPQKAQQDRSEESKSQHAERLHKTLGFVARQNYSGVGRQMNMLDSMHMASGSALGRLKFGSGLIGAYGTKMIEHPTNKGEYALRSGVLAKTSRGLGGALGMAATGVATAGVVGDLAEHAYFGSYENNARFGGLGYSMAGGSGRFGMSAARTQSIQSDFNAISQGIMHPNWGIGQEMKLHSNLIEAGINPNDDSGKKFANVIRGISKGGLDSGLATQMLIGTERTGTPQQLNDAAAALKSLTAVAKSTGVSLNELQKNVDGTAAALTSSTGAGQSTSIQGAARMTALLGGNAGSATSLTTNLLNNPAIKFSAMQQAGGADQLAKNPQYLVSSMLPLLSQALGAGSVTNMTKHWSQYGKQYEQLYTNSNGMFGQLFGGGQDANTLGKLMTDFPKRNAAYQMDTSDLAMAAAGKLTSAQGKTDATSIASAFMGKKDLASWEKKEHGKSGLQMLKDAVPTATNKPTMQVEFTGAANKWFKGKMKDGGGKNPPLDARTAAEVPGYVSMAGMLG